MTTTYSSRSRRSQPSAASNLVQLGVVACATLLSAVILRIELVPRLAGDQPALAVSLGYAPASALRRLAENQRTLQADAVPDADADTDAARLKQQADLAWATGLAAIARQPFSADGLRILGQAAEQRGDVDETRRLMQAAANLSHRESVAEIWLANDAISAKDYPRALSHIDDLLRASPQTTEAVLAALTPLAMLPEAMPSLVALMASDPPWRAGFLDQLPTRVADPVTLEPFYTQLLQMRPPLPDLELKSLLDAMIQHGEIGQAYYTWLKTLPDSRLADLGYLYNGDFKFRPSNLPFDWELNPITGATSTIDVVPGDSGQRVLTVDFADARVPYKNAAKLLTLPAGRYHLTGRVRAFDLDSQRGMTWRVTCLDAPDTPLAETPRVMGTTDGWEPFETTFTVPESNCDAQWLRLELAYRTNAEQRISGEIRYADFKLDKIELPTDPVPPPARVEQPDRPTAQPARQPSPKGGKR